MSKAIDLSHIYQLRNDFTIIGLTGRTGSGCSEIALQLAKGFDDGSNFETPYSSLPFKHNSQRKYRIIYEYAKVNFEPYSLIKYKDVLTLFILQFSFEEFIKYLMSDDLKQAFIACKYSIKPDFSQEIENLNKIKSEFDELSQEYLKIETRNLNEKNNWIELCEFFFEGKFRKFSSKFHQILEDRSLLKRNKTLQIISNNLRKSGHPYESDDLFPEKIDTIVDLINDLIKSHRKKIFRTQIVIDSLRNPFEIMYFKQRYAAYYTIAVNREDDARNYSIVAKSTEDNSKYEDDVQKLLKEEYQGGEDFEFHKQKVADCIQQADIHISFLTTEDADKKNQEKEVGNNANPHRADNTSPYFSWRMQLLKYVSLISHPGLVTPSPEERCMQLAYTAKHNSGCISRHVGAAITDENYSIKAIGWNNTPEGQVPCVLRSAEDLLNPSKDIDAFTPYERTDEKFKDILSEKYTNPIAKNRENLKGRNVCFCFKSLKNCISEGKNQVHTRSLHAEESAFLQVTKYGGTGIKGGKLFTTASPCELCSKKAYQLGIKVIYYIDPYPGISKKHILDAGVNQIEVRLFNGAIGNAYHWLYDPVMPYKDELALLLGNEITDLTSQYKKTIEDQGKKLDDQEKEINRLNTIIIRMNQSADLPVPTNNNE